MKLTIALLVFFISVIFLTSLVMFLNLPSDDNMQNWSSNEGDEKEEQEISEPAEEPLKEEFECESDLNKPKAIEKSVRSLNSTKENSAIERKSVPAIEQGDNGKIGNRKIRAVKKKPKDVLSNKNKSNPDIIKKKIKSQR